MAAGCLPTVTVAVCTRDRADHLLRCLKSLLALDYDSFDIVVVDNGSRSFSAPRLEYCRRTRFFSVPVPGLSSARNFAAAQSNAEIIAYIDDDAEADPLWLQAATGHFSDETIGCVTGRVVPLDSSSLWAKHFLETGWNPGSEIAARFDLQNYDPFKSAPGIGCNLLVRKSVMERFGFSPLFGAGTQVGASEELYFFYKVICAGLAIFYDPGVVVMHQMPVTKEEYRYKIRRNTRARAALFTKFLLTEKGRRTALLTHLMRLATSAGKNTGPVDPMIKIRALATGPLALFLSTIRFSRTKEHVKNGKLLAEFGPGS